MDEPSRSAPSLRALMTRAMSDLEITPSEFQQIMDYAGKDASLDKEEEALLAQFHQMLSDGTLKRVRE